MNRYDSTTLWLFETSIKSNSSDFLRIDKKRVGSTIQKTGLEMVFKTGGGCER